MLTVPTSPSTQDPDRPHHRVGGTRGLVRTYLGHGISARTDPRTDSARNIRRIPMRRRGSLVLTSTRSRSVMQGLIAFTRRDASRVQCGADFNTGFTSATRG